MSFSRVVILAFLVGALVLASAETNSQASNLGESPKKRKKKAKNPSTKKSVPVPEQAQKEKAPFTNPAAPASDAPATPETPVAPIDSAAGAQPVAADTIDTQSAPSTATEEGKTFEASKSAPEEASPLPNPSASSGAGTEAGEGVAATAEETRTGKKRTYSEAWPLKVKETLLEIKSKVESGQTKQGITAKHLDDHLATLDELHKKVKNAKTEEDKIQNQHSEIQVKHDDKASELFSKIQKHVDFNGKERVDHEEIKRIIAEHKSNRAKIVEEYQQSKTVLQKAQEHTERVVSEYDTHLSHLESVADLFEL